VVLNLRLREMSGLGLLETIRALPGYRTVPVIVLVGGSDAALYSGSLAWLASHQFRDEDPSQAAQGRSEEHRNIEGRCWSVRLVIQGRNDFEVPDVLRRYAEKRLKKLERLLDGEDIEVQVAVLTNRGRYTVEVTVFVEGYILRGEETAETTHSAVDLVLEKLERQVEKYRTKLIKKKRLEGSELKGKIVSQPPEEEGAEEGEDQKVVKVKRFPVKPMSVEEAILQMDLLGHDFFVFANAETEKVNVLYRRKDGRYGLIEPEFD